MTTSLKSVLKTKRVVLSEFFLTSVLILILSDFFRQDKSKNLDKIQN